MVIISAKKLPSMRPVDALLPANASTKPVPSKKPPVYIIPMMQLIMSTRIGNTRSITFPLPFITSCFASAYGLSPVVNKSPFLALASCFAIGPKSTCKTTSVTIAIIVKSA